MPWAFYLLSALFFALKHKTRANIKWLLDIPRNGGQHGDVSLGDPDDFVDEGNRWRLNYGSTSGHPNACDGHFM